jgi:hypothetical protein
MNARLTNWLAAAIMALVLSAACIWDEPAELDAAQAVAADLQDAINNVAISARIERAERQLQQQSIVAAVQP